MVLRVNDDLESVPHANRHVYLAIDLDASFEHFGCENKLFAESLGNGSFLETFAHIVVHFITFTLEDGLLVDLLCQLSVYQVNCFLLHISNRPLEMVHLERTYLLG